MRLFANPTVRNGIPSEDKGAIRRQGCRLQKKRLVIPSSTGGGREPPRAAGLLDQQRLRRFGNVALCARIPRSGRLEAPSSPSGRFGDAAPCVRLSDIWRYVPEASGRAPHRGILLHTQKGRRPGIRATAWGREGGGSGRPPLQGKGPAPGAPPRTGTGLGREGRPAPRDRGGAGRPAPRAARASRRPSWSPAPRPAAPAGAARSRRSARRCRSRR